MPNNTEPRYRSTVLNQLNDEWRRMCRSQTTLRAVQGWNLTTDPVSSLDDVLTLAGFRGSKIDDAADRVLLQLVHRASSDQLAARIVLQRVLPPLVSVAQRRGKQTQGGFDEALATLLSHGWEVIRTYPVERRPAKVAANITRDAEYFGFVRRNRQVAEMQSFDPDSIPAAPHYYNSSEQLDDLLEHARRCRVSARSIEVLRVLGTHSLAELAQQQGLSPRAARRRRQEALNELRVRTRSAA